MKNIGVFIMGAGKGSRLQYNLGNIIPKCLLPLKLIDKDEKDELLIDRILQAVEVMSSHTKFNFDIHLIVNNEYNERVINALHDLSNTRIDHIHQIPWNKSSISTFLFCNDFIQQNKYDEVIFINGDCYFRGFDSFNAFNEFINTPGDCAIVENSPEGYMLKNTWSSVAYNNKFELLCVNPDWCDTLKSLRDVTKLTFNTYSKLVKIARNSLDNKDIIWWEMLFINLINYGKLKMKAIVTESSDKDTFYPSPVFINVNSIRDDLTMEEVFVIVEKHIPKLFEKGE